MNHSLIISNSLKVREFTSVYMGFGSDRGERIWNVGTFLYSSEGDMSTPLSESPLMNGF